MSKRLLKRACFFIYTLIIVLLSFYIGKYVQDTQQTKTVNISNVTAEEEGYYTAMEEDGKLSLYKDGEFLMSLDTNIEMLPTIVRSQLKKGVEFTPSELPEIIEAFAE